MKVGWRAQVALTIAPLVALSVGVILLLPADRVESIPAPSVASETQCLSIKQPQTVDGLNRFVDTLRGNAEFQGADVGASVTLSDGRSLWVFGDTLRSPDFVGQRFVRNSMLLFDAECANVVLPADHGALIPDRNDGVGYWPMSIAMVSRKGYDLLTVSANRVRSNGGLAAAGDTAAFTNLGPALAEFLVPHGQTPQLLRVVDIGPDSADRSRPAWGAALAAYGDQIYLYGTANPGKDLVFGYLLSVARAPADTVLDRSTWSFWDGHTWVRSASAAAELIPAVGGVSQTLSVFSSGGQWFALSKRDEFVGSDLVLWSAPNPAGPFTAGSPVAEIPSEGRTLRYMPLAHPDLLPEPGSVVVSFSQNRTDVKEILDNPFLYRPRFLRVPLP